MTSAADVTLLFQQLLMRLAAILGQEKLAGKIPCKVVLAGCLEHGPDGRVVCWDDPALKPQHHIFYGGASDDSLSCTVSL